MWKQANHANVVCDCAGTLEGLFSQILADHEEDDVVRDRAIKFLVLKLKTLGEEAMDKQAEEFIMTQSKKVGLVSVVALGRVYL